MGIYKCWLWIGEVQLVVKMNSQPVIRVTADGGRVDDSRPHTIIVRADSTHGTIQLDDAQQHSFTIVSGDVDTVTVTTSSVHLGSLTSSSDTPRLYLSPTGFVGCIQVSLMHPKCTVQWFNAFIHSSFIYFCKINRWQTAPARTIDMA